MSELASILDKDHIISDVYDNIKYDIVTYGTNLVLKDLGFMINEYDKLKIKSRNKDNKFDLFSDLENNEEIEKLVIRLKKEINEEVIKKIISNEMFEDLKKIAVDTIIKDAEIYLRQQIQSEIQKQYYEFIKKEFINDLMDDPRFKEFKLSQL